MQSSFNSYERSETGQPFKMLAFKMNSNRMLMRRRAKYCVGGRGGVSNCVTLYNYRYYFEVHQR